MKAFASIAFVAILSQDTTSFSPVSSIQSITTHITSSNTLLRAAELKPEPEGGEELTKISTSLPNSRMKNLGAEDEEDVYKFWLSATADGELVRKNRLQTEKEASKKANFPGFRKVRYISIILYISMKGVELSHDVAYVIHLLLYTFRVKFHHMLNLKLQRLLCKRLSSKHVSWKSVDISP